jgi:riboflavin synthase
MFTGIIQHKGQISTIERKESITRLVVANALSDALPLGESIAVDGVCLTLAEKNPGCAVFDLMPETLAKTTLGNLAVGMDVHLESSLKVGDTIGGHFVYGHVDGVGTVVTRDQKGDSVEFTIAAPAELSRYFVPKGSVAVRGVSLTIVSVQEGNFSFQCIPHTLVSTTFGSMRVGDRVNIEIDMLARYVQNNPQI